MSTFKQNLVGLVAALPDDQPHDEDALAGILLQAADIVATDPARAAATAAEQQAQAADIGVYREFRRQREQNPFAAAAVLELAGVSSIERGRVLDTADSEPPDAVA